MPLNISAFIVVINIVRIIIVVSAHIWKQEIKFFILHYKTDRHFYFLIKELIVYHCKVKSNSIVFTDTIAKQKI